MFFNPPYCAPCNVYDLNMSEMDYILDRAVPSCHMKYIVESFSKVIYEFYWVNVIVFLYVMIREGLVGLADNWWDCS